MTRALVARKRKIFALFFALAASIGLSWATTVTWDNSTLSSIYIRDGQSFTKDGVTLTALDGMIAGMDGAWMGNSDDASYKFSTSLGNFTKIEITADINELGGSGWAQTSPGAVWTGDANETTFGGFFENVTQVVFTIAESTVAVTGVTLNKSAAELTVGGENLTLIPTVLPSNATNKEVMWTSDNGYVAVVENGGVVRPVGPGTANITVTTVEGDYFATCVVTVTDAAPANVCGDGLTWELSEGVLTISYDGEGTGEMTDFGYENDQNPVNVAPWKENKSEITTVIVGDGVKSIGNYAFNDLSENFTAVTIANSVERIGVFAFTNSEEITAITLPSSLKTIDDQGFANCGFTSITIPSGVTSIGYKAFSYCTGLTSLTCEATTPPTLASGVFYKISNTSSIPLYVPSGSVTAYEAAAQWNAFDIQGYDPASATTVTWNSSNISDLIVFSISESYSKEGVTLSGNADKIEAYWYGSDENNSGISFHANATGGFTFSNTLGKNFTKIEMTLNVPGGWNYANLGSGWNIDGMKAIWTGNASTVDLLKDESNFNSTPVNSIVFYFEGDSEGGGSTDVIPCTAADLGKVLCTDGSIYATVSEAAAASKTAAAVIAYVDTQNGKALALALADDGGEMDWATAKTTAPAHTPAVSGGTWTLASKDEWDNMINAAGSYTALRDGFSAVGGTNMKNVGYWSSTSFMHYAWCYKFNNGEWFDDYQEGDNYVRACLAFDIPAAPAYETVMNLINAIGEVAYTAECKAKIDEARAAYNALSDGDKEQVNNIITLTTAETAYKNLVLDAAQPAIAAIKAIPSPITSNLKLSAYEKVTAAREAYDALTDEEKAAIPEYLAILEEAEAAFAAIPSVGSETVITWDKNTGIEKISGTTTSPAYEGITISIKGGGFGPENDMLRFNIAGLGLSFEFANTLEGNFQKIVISSTKAMPSTPLAGMGEGWAASNENKTATWTGDAATVKIWDGLTATSYWDVNTIQFTLGATVSATEAAQAAKDLIEAIGEVSYPASKEAIKAAREAVDALGANASLLDDADLQKLTQAEAAYAQLLAQAVKAVKDQIDALPATPLTDATKKLSEYNKVTDAREAYDALSDDEKAAVTNYDKLEAAEAAFAAIGGGTGLNVSTEDIGKVLCADGSLYATKDEATAASKTPVAMIAYVEDSKGLAIALEDESNPMIWSTAITTAAAHTPAVTGGTWKLPSLLEWQQMFVGCGADLTPSETSGDVTDYLGLRDKLLAAGGNGFVEWSYWTTTEWADNPAEAWDPYFSFSPEIVKWYKNKKDRDDFYIRAILAFNVVASTALADAQAAKDLIDAIPAEITLDAACVNAIKDAREAVTALGENASLLDNADIDKLAKAEADFALLIKDATAVVDMIDAIDEVTFSPESKGKIVDAREAYEALSDELKSYVSNLGTLTAAEAAYEAARPFATVTTVPAAVEALQYTGAAQTLITAGAAEHGTVLYSLDGENYSAELPTALLPGAYTIYYKVQATDDYKDVAPVTVIATIAYNYPATYGLFGIPEGWSVKVNDEEVAVVNGAVKNIAANDRFDIMPVKPEDVKRVEIVPYLLDLATVTDSVIYILDGDSITGTANGHITVVIVPDAKVYFKDVNLTNTGSHPAVLCGGNAEIVVVGENTITCTKEGEYGIRAAGAGTTLTISGDKTLLNADINPNGGTVNQ